MYMLAKIENNPTFDKIFKPHKNKSFYHLCFLITIRRAVRKMNNVERSLSASIQNNRALSTICRYTVLLQCSVLPSGTLNL